MSFVFGALAAVLWAGCMAAGVYLGWKAHEKYGKPELPEMQEAERKRLIAEQDAFRQQMNYNADMAYGLDGSGEDAVWP